MKKNISTFLLFLLLAPSLFGQNTQTKESMTNREFKVINHSYGNSKELNIKHISFNLEVDFNTKSLDGTATISYEEVMSTNELILDTKELKITKVVGKNDIELPFELGKEDPILGSPLWIDISSKPEKVTVHYTTSPSSEAIQWLSPEQTAQKVHPFLFTQSQAILARSWAPLMDTPSERFTYDANIKCPKELMALMSASNPKEKSMDGNYSFEMPQPIPSYLLALAVGDLEYQELGAQCGVYAEPSMMEISKSEFSDLQKMITSAEELYGDYAWGMYDLLVLPASFPFGGMENPRLTFVTPTIITGDKSLVALVAHELAHSWSGNLVTNSSWNDFWLNEGFTVYFETRIMEAVFGKEYANMEAENGYRELLEEIEYINSQNPNDTKLKLDLDNRNPDDGMTSIAYEKGRFFLLLIEQTVGREKWDIFLNQYFTENSFKTMNTEDFLLYMDKHLFKDTPNLKDSLNLDEWIYQSGLPANCPIVTSELLDIVRTEISNFEKSKSVAAINANGWTTHQWLYFLRNCDEQVIQTNMHNLDTKYKFTSGSNSEILCDWFKHGIASGYKENDFENHLKAFLIRVGRRKFLEPLYKKLAKHDIEFGKTVFAEASSGYHSVSRNTIEEILNGSK